MSGIEEQLARDIAAVTKAATVTEGDLSAARDSIHDRVEAGRRRDRRRTVGAFAAAAAVVAGVSFGAFQAISVENTVTPAGGGERVDDVYDDFLTGDAPTPENLNGLWRVDNGNTVVWFRSDGTVHFSDQGAVISDPTTTGTYRIEGDTIAVTTTEAPRCVGADFTARAAIPEPGRVYVVLAEPKFGTCGTVATTIALERLVPTEHLGSAKAPVGGGWKPVTSDALLPGDWLAEGGGYLLEIGADGTYYLVDDSAEIADNGYWRSRNSTLELFSRTESPQCDEGDWLIFGTLEYHDRGVRWMRGTVEQNDCGGEWTPDAWLLIPDGTEN